MGLFGWLRRSMGQWVIPGGAGLTRGGYRFQNDTLASNETIFSAISMLSGAMASLPITLRKDTVRVLGCDHPAARLLEWGPNPNMTTFQFVRSLEACRDTTGAGYAIKELDTSGRVESVWQLKTEYVTPMIERETKELYYHIRDPDDGQDIYLHNALVIAVTHISTDGITPVNPLDVLTSSLKYDKEVKEFSINQMQKGLRAKYAIKFPTSLNEEQTRQYDGLLQKFKKNGIMYLDRGKDIVDLKEGNIIDPKVFEVENITIARVARAYTIPLEKFLPEKTSYSSAEQSDLNYLRDTILPIVRMYEQEFTRVLLTPLERIEGYQIKFALNGFARADMETRGKFYTQGIRSGWFCPDDVRELEDLPPIPGGLGKEFYVSKDLRPIRDRE